MLCNRLDFPPEVHFFSSRAFFSTLMEHYQHAPSFSAVPYTGFSPALSRLQVLALDIKS